MTTNRFVALAFAALICTASAQAVTIDTVPVGNPDNSADTRYDVNGVGSVDYSYRIGKTEVTNAQYVEFLNGVDPTGANTLQLYNTFMTSDSRGGVTFNSSAADGIKYSVKAPALSGMYNYANKPVVLLSWFDAIRFVNWLHNGQGGPGSTDTGAYTLLGGTPIPSNANTIARNLQARWWLPSEDEWYKAAYYDPGAGIYYDYATGTSDMPNNNLPSADTGNSANFRQGDPGYTTNNPNFPMTDADAYKLSASPYGTLDQSGNVAEFIENLVDASRRRVRDGYWDSHFTVLKASSSGSINPLRGGTFGTGFRVASIPEPSTLLLGALAGMGLLWRTKRTPR